MSFQNETQEILAFCYDGPTTIQTAVNVVKKHNPNLDNNQADGLAESTLQILFQQGLLLKTLDGVLFSTSQGEEKAEQVLKSLGYFDLLKQ